MVSCLDFAVLQTIFSLQDSFKMSVDLTAKAEILSCVRCRVAIEMLVSSNFSSKGVIVQVGLVGQFNNTLTGIWRKVS